MADSNETVEISAFGTVTISQLVDLIRVSETSERYEDMCEFTSELVIKRCKATEELSVEEIDCNLMFNRRGARLYQGFYFAIDIARHESPETEIDMGASLLTGFVLGTVIGKIVLRLKR